MAYFPMFVNLTEKTVLVVGEGSEANRKAAAMAPFCRRVLRSPYPPAWDVPPDVVILAEKDHPDNGRWAELFAARGIPVNVTDRPELCSFQFPSLLVRGEVAVGISTGGKSPALAAALRRRIADALPEDLAQIAQQAAALTETLRKTVPDPKARTEILNTMLEEWMAE